MSGGVGPMEGSDRPGHCKLRFSSKKICPSDKIVHDISFGHGQLVKGQFCHIIHDIET